MKTKPNPLQHEIGDNWKRAEASGMDMSMIASALAKAPAERLANHDRALKTAMALRTAMRKRHA